MVSPLPAPLGLRPHGGHLDGLLGVFPDLRERDEHPPSGGGDRPACGGGHLRGDLGRGGPVRRGHRRPLQRPRASPASPSSDIASSPTRWGARSPDWGDWCWPAGSASAIPRRARGSGSPWTPSRSEEHTSELQSPTNLVCRLLLEKKK